MTREPIILPGRETAGQRWQREARQWRRQARVRAERLETVLRAARTSEGRRRNLAALLAMTVAGGLLLGLATGRRRRR